MQAEQSEYLRVRRFQGSNFQSLKSHILQAMFENTVVTLVVDLI